MGGGGENIINEDQIMKMVFSLDIMKELSSKF